MKIDARAAAAIAAVLATLRLAALADTVPSGDPAHGKAVYAMCMYCHAIDANRVGPLHRGLFGRRAGSVPGFDYSAAMRRAGENGLVWNAQTLDRYLTNPQKMVPGTRMLFGGIADARTRADLIAYLEAATATAPNAAAGTRGAARP